MIAEVCRSYGWTDEYVLRMPVRRFFAMLQAARQLRAQDFADLVDIAFVPAAKPSYAEKLRAQFEIPRSAPRRQPPAHYTGKDARQALINMMGLKKRAKVNDDGRR